MRKRSKRNKDIPDRVGTSTETSATESRSSNENDAQSQTAAEPPGTSVIERPTQPEGFLKGWKRRLTKKKTSNPAQVQGENDKERAGPSCSNEREKSSTLTLDPPPRPYREAEDDEVPGCSYKATPATSATLVNADSEEDEVPISPRSSEGQIRLEEKLGLPKSASLMTQKGSLDVSGSEESDSPECSSQASSTIRAASPDSEAYKYVQDYNLERLRTTPAIRQEERVEPRNSRTMLLPCHIEGQPVPDIAWPGYLDLSSSSDSLILCNLVRPVSSPPASRSLDTLLAIHCQANSQSITGTNVYGAHELRLYQSQSLGSLNSRPLSSALSLNYRSDSAAERVTLDRVAVSFDPGTSDVVPSTQSINLAALDSSAAFTRQVPSSSPTCGLEFSDSTASTSSDEAASPEPGPSFAYDTSPEASDFEDALEPSSASETACSTSPDIEDAQELLSASEIALSTSLEAEDLPGSVKVSALSATASVRSALRSFVRRVSRAVHSRRSRRHRDNATTSVSKKKSREVGVDVGVIVPMKGILKRTPSCLSVPTPSSGPPSEYQRRVHWDPTVQSASDADNYNRKAVMEICHLRNTQKQLQIVRRFQAYIADRIKEDAHSRLPTEEEEYEEEEIDYKAHTSQADAQSAQLQTDMAEQDAIWWSDSDEEMTSDEEESTSDDDPQASDERRPRKKRGWFARFFCCCLKPSDDMEDESSFDVKNILF